MDPARLFSENLSLIEQVIGGVCRRARLYGADAEDFASSAQLALVENDYAILRKYEGRAALSTYLTIVIERLLSDQRMHDMGRWHPSAEASRMGAAGVLLETLVRRDRRALDAALPHLQALDASLTRAQAAAMLARLPERRPRPVTADVEQVPEDQLVAREEPDAPLLAEEARRLSEQAGRVVREQVAALDLDDRVLLRLRFVAAMSIADIARATRLPQRPLYRRFEVMLAALRRALVAAGITRRDAEDVLAAAAVEELDLGLAEISADRQSNPMETRA
jgi:RNA polymerase sigma factor for flagellar operon FliA